MRRNAASPLVFPFGETISASPTFPNPEGETERVGLAEPRMDPRECWMADRFIASAGFGIASFGMALPIGL
jgi:hypothetical protein